MSNHTEYCHRCGVPIGEPSAFCSSCGAALTEPAAGASSAAPSRTAPGTSAAGAPHPPAASPPAGSHRATAPAAQAPVAPGAPPPGAPPGAPPPGTPSPGASPPPADRPLGSSRNWLPFAAAAAAAIVVTGAVVALLLALGGSAGKNVKSTSATREQALQLLAANGTTTVSRAAPGLFALVTAGRLSAIVPAGWRATAQAAGAATRAEFADPGRAGSTLTIVAQTGGSSDRNRALAARRAVSGKGNVVSSFGPTAFPGGREAWHLTYTATGVTHETYFYSACSSATAMVVDVAASSSVFQREHAALEAAAARAEPSC